MTIKKITDLEGVYASGSHCGIKESQEADLAYIFVPNAVASAGVFTTNKATAPSVIHTKKALKRGTIKAIIINSGNANVATSTAEKDTKTMAKLAANALALTPSEVAVASTGIIGKALPIDKVSEGIASLLKNPFKKSANRAAKAILTTDTCTKKAVHQKKIGKKQITVAGFTKGSGMIAPNMATTLAFLVTNAQISQAKLQQMLSKAIEDSYNMLSVDTDTSTSDMALLIATGEKKFNTMNKTELQAFQTLLTDCLIDLAKQIARDGEGAKTLIEVRVEKAASKKDARAIAKAVVDSPLVKTAVYGADPNWGRILMAAGKAEARLNPKKLSIAFGKNLKVFHKGIAVEPDLDKIKAAMKEKEMLITLNCNLGTAEARAWGCDLTEKYISINTEYN